MCLCILAVRGIKIGGKECPLALVLEVQDDS